MRLKPRKTAPDSENVLPLINIVFLLLIFFMVAGALERSDLFAVEPPATRAAAESDAAVGVLLLAADGRLALDGTAVTREDLPAALEAFRAAHPDEILRLKADAGGDAVAVVGLLDELRAAGVQQVVLLATEAGR